jgi:hypothetical protein
MKPSNGFAPSIATGLLLLAVCAQTACSTPSRRPDSAPTPPRVDCESGPVGEQIPPIPPLWGMDEWAAQVLGIVERSFTRWAAERACTAQLRAKGVIL